jgi:hypothetical protein
MIGTLGMDQAVVNTMFAGGPNAIFGENNALGLASYLEKTFSNSLMQL